MGSKDSYWSDILDSGTLCCYRSGAVAHRGPHLPAPAQRLHHQRHQVAAQGLRRPLPAGAVHSATRPARRRLRAHAAPPAQRGRLPGLGFADWIIGTARTVKGVETKAPANTLDWARFDEVWLG
ncbi:hypothetical protein LT493_10015 [Streptomyces tricolor]|nr:hypothetical protein [Streptomyces tricolor]